MKIFVGGLDMWGNLMATQDLYEAKVRKVHQLDRKNIKDEMMMALRDEVMEYAKSTKCFKVWSLKEADPQDVRLEEFSDGIHLYLGRGLELGINPDDLIEASKVGDQIAKYQDHAASKKSLLTFLLGRAMDHLYTPSLEQSKKEQKEKLLMSFSYFWAAGRVDGFTNEEIEKAYYLKNRINQERLKSGY